MWSVNSVWVSFAHEVYVMHGVCDISAVCIICQEYIG